MSILAAGSFRVSDYRKAIPDWVKVVCAIRAYPTWVEGPLEAWVRSLRYDHRPPLQDRPYNVDKGDFIPPQNDPDHIEAIHIKKHDERTFGRKQDAEKVVTTRGSDLGEAAHIRTVSDTEAIHQAKMASKNGDYAEAARILGNVKQKKRLQPKKKIQSRGFQKRTPLRHLDAGNAT